MKSRLDAMPLFLLDDLLSCSIDLLTNSLFCFFEFLQSNALTNRQKTKTDKETRHVMIGQKIWKNQIRIRGRIRRTALVLSCSSIKCLFLFRISFQISFCMLDYYIYLYSFPEASSFAKKDMNTNLGIKRLINSLSPIYLQP